MNGMCSSVVAWNNVKPAMMSVYKNDFGHYSWSNSEFINDVWLDVFILNLPRISWHVRVLSIINHVYMHSFRSAIEATEKLNSNLVIFLGVGAFEQLFGPGRRFGTKWMVSFSSWLPALFCLIVGQERKLRTTSNWSWMDVSLQVTSNGRRTVCYQPRVLQWVGAIWSRDVHLGRRTIWAVLQGKITENKFLCYCLFYASES